MDMVVGQNSVQPKIPLMAYLCSITEFADHERRAMSQDHRFDSAWFGAGAGLKATWTRTSVAFDCLSLDSDLQI